MFIYRYGLLLVFKYLEIIEMIIQSQTHFSIILGIKLIM